MQIILDHAELILLQRLNRSSELFKYHPNPSPIKQSDTLSILLESGLITVGACLYRNKIKRHDIFGPISITPLGVAVLKANLPYLDPLNRIGAVYINITGYSYHGSSRGNLTGEIKSG